MSRLKILTIVATVILTSLFAIGKDPDKKAARKERTETKQKVQVETFDSLRYKVGQMLVCGFNGAAVDEHIMMMVSRHFIGGVILFDKNMSNNGGERNIRNPQQVSQLVSMLKDLSSEKLLVAIDQEGGSVERLSPSKGFAPSRSAQYLGEVDDADTTHFWADLQANQLQDLGINLNFAPCVDLELNPNNKIIAKRQRAFDDSVDVVVRNARIFIEEHHEAEVLTCLKHFPGHGSSSSDTHDGMVDITDTFQDCELEPYREFVKGGYNDIVMMSHLINRRVDSLPASLSKVFIDSILRQEIGYQGVVATDDLNMGAIANHFEYEKALELAINAGVDMIVIGNNGASYRPKLIEITIISIMDLVKSGKISQSRIDEAYNRIKLLKNRVN